MKRTRTVSVFILALCTLITILNAVFAANWPTGPTTLNVTTEESLLPFSPRTDNALAGNISKMIINASTQTRSWQGYYGNITGEIVLDDALNNTLYDWVLTEPRGEIYAAPDPIVWSNSLDCLNFTSTYNNSEAENDFGIDAGDMDGVNETFNHHTNTYQFDIGTLGNVIESGMCWATFMYQKDGGVTEQTQDFQEVLLQDGTQPVFVALIEANEPGNWTNNVKCFNGVDCDFQFMVLENGHQGDTAVNSYFFYVELE